MNTYHHTALLHSEFVKQYGYRQYYTIVASHKKNSRLILSTLVQCPARKIGFEDIYNTSKMALGSYEN